MTSAFVSLTVQEVKKMDGSSGREYHLLSCKASNGSWVRFPLFGNHAKYAPEIKPGDKILLIGSVDYVKGKDGRKRYLVNPFEIYRANDGIDINSVVYAGKVSHSGFAEDGTGYAYIKTGHTSSSLVKFESEPPAKDSFVYVECELVPRGEFSFNVVAKKVHRLGLIGGTTQQPKSEAQDKDLDASEIPF